MEKNIAMIELKVTVEDEKHAEKLLLELNSREGISAKVSTKPYSIDDECQSSMAAEPTSSFGTSANTDFSNDATHFFDGEKLYITRQYYEDYIKDLAFNLAHPEEQKNEPLRTISNEELASCITLEEFREEMTEMIHKHYHPQK